MIEVVNVTLNQSINKAMPDALDDGHLGLSCFSRSIRQKPTDRPPPECKPTDLDDFGRFGLRSVS
jgi:hypothetical protein